MAHRERTNPYLSPATTSDPETVAEPESGDVWSQCACVGAVNIACKLGLLGFVCLFWKCMAGGVPDWVCGFFSAWWAGPFVYTFVFTDLFTGVWLATSLSWPWKWLGIAAALVAFLNPISLTMMMQVLQRIGIVV